MSPPFKTVEFELLYGIGINREGEVLDKALKAGTVKRAGVGLHSVMKSWGRVGSRSASV